MAKKREPKPMAESTGRRNERFADPTFKDAVIDEIVERLQTGESLVSICDSDKRLPCYHTVAVWQDADPALDLRITRAREVGFIRRGERAVEDAKKAQDAPLGRLAFDAERWYLGKLSKAFADKVILSGDKDNPIQHSYDLSNLTDAQLEALAAIGLGDEGK